MYSATIVIPGNILDQHYTVSCDCGYFRDCGYMGVTADRLADWHREKGPLHNVTITVTDAEPLTRQTMMVKLRKSRLHLSKER